MSRKIRPFCLTLMLCSLLTNQLTLIVFANEPHWQAQTTSLTNKDVIEMIKMGLGQEIILTKIKSSACTFDTSTAALQELKSAGVPDNIILAMVQAPSASHSANVQSSATFDTPVTKKDVNVPDGTQVEVELKMNVSSEENKEGDSVDFAVVQPVEIDGFTVIKQGAAVRGYVAKAKKSGHWGHQGKLDWALNDVLTVDGKRIPLRFTKVARGESSGGTVAVAAVATTVLLGPVGLLWGLKKGKPATIAAGNRYTVFVQGNNFVKGEPVIRDVQEARPPMNSEPQPITTQPAPRQEQKPPPVFVNLPPKTEKKKPPM